MVSEKKLRKQSILSKLAVDCFHRERNQRNKQNVENANKSEFNYEYLSSRVTSLDASFRL